MHKRVGPGDTHQVRLADEIALTFDQRMKEIERSRAEHTAQSDQLSTVQGRYYEIGAEISRAEQEIEHARELRARQRQELTQLGLGLEEATQQRARDGGRVGAPAGVGRGQGLPAQ